ncbi:MAG: hypothetical protein JXN65_09920 [Clostridia bacterium]|nr:hypothetical protein [Clostridia bacterium]
MDGIGGVISLIIFIAFAVLRGSQKNAKQQQQQQQRPNTTNTNTYGSNNTIQAQLNRAMNQINDIKKAAYDQTQSTNPNAANNQNTMNPERQDVYRSSLEGQIVEGAKVEGYQVEGTIIEGYKMEGAQVEGLTQKHRTGKFKPDSYAAAETSMQPGFAGEGCDEHYDMEIEYSSVVKNRVNKNPLYFSDNPLLQGIVMSQVLERPKRRQYFK